MPPYTVITATRLRDHNLHFVTSERAQLCVGCSQACVYGHTSMHRVRVHP